MLETPQIVESTAQRTAVIAMRIPRSEIQAVMGPGIAELVAAVTRIKGERVVWVR